MKILFKTLSAKVTKTDLLVLLSPEGKTPKLPSGVSIPKSVATSFLGKSRETRFADTIDGPAERVLLIGLGKGKPFDLETVRRAAAIAAQKAEKTDAASVTFWVDLKMGKSTEDFGKALGLYGKSSPREVPRPLRLFPRVSLQPPKGCSKGKP